jgi:hypothetical protein
VEPVAAGGVVVLLMAAFGGLLATIGWWDRADQTG